MKKIINWLLVSNRWKHLICGAIIAVVASLGTFLLVHVCNNGLTSALVALGCTLVAMMTVEYIQTMYEDKWDWLDVLAGCLIPLIVVIVELIKLMI